MTNIEQRQIKILKAALANEDGLSVFTYAKENDLNKDAEMRTAEHLAKIWALRITPEIVDGEGDKIIWANFQTERIIENPKILNLETNFTVENYKDSFVLKGDSNSINHSDFSKEINTSINKPSETNNNKPTKSMQIFGVVVSIIIAIIMIILKYVQII